MNDLVDSRILGAIRFADAVTGSTVQRPLSLELGALRAVQSRSGIYVVRQAPGLDAVSQHFDLTGVPEVAPSAFPIKVSDPQYFYLPRTASVTLPRSATAPATDPASIFQPQRIALYPAPSAMGRATWATVFVAVTGNGNPKTMLSWVLLQAQLASDSSVLANSFTDQRGEGQLSLPVRGIRANTAGGTEVVAIGTDLKIVAIYDPTIPQKGASYVPDPDDLLSRAQDPSMKQTAAKVTVRAGQTQSITIDIALS